METFHVLLVLALVLPLLGALSPLFIKRLQQNHVYAGLYGLIFGLFSLAVATALEARDTSEMLEKASRIQFGVGAEDEDVSFVGHYLDAARQIVDNRVFERRMLKLQNTFMDEYRALSQGRMQFGSNDLEMNATKLIESAEQEVLATSLFLEGWQDRWGAAYWEAQQGLLRNSVSIKRIFATSGPLSENGKHILLDQHRAGVEVYLIESSELGANEIRDFIVVDRDIAGEVLFTTGDRITGGLITLDKESIASFVDAFETLLARSDRFDPGTISRDSDAGSLSGFSN